ncbi:MAG: hypothetical protein PVH87_23880 [Desulfobacteraceae bacterium]|jgi:hypothetical protein
MYLARQCIDGKTHFIIRQSYLATDCFKSRDLFYLGTDPSRFISYPGGNSYYYDTCIEEALSQKGLNIQQDDLDPIFFEFLPPEIQRVIIGFDHGYRHRPNFSQKGELGKAPPIHDFDKRRFHYLRFGHSRQRNIHGLPEKVFRPLQNKSRDELEQYFLTEERRLRHHEKRLYVATIFRLTTFQPRADANQPLLVQLDGCFMDRLCRLNRDNLFLAGESKPKGLFEYLIKYVIIYFDFEPRHPNTDHIFISEFIRRHRRYRPIGKTKIKIKEIENLFGYEWKALKHMNRTKLARLFRRLALKHHPDQGGDGETFRRLTQYYRALLSRKPKD